MLIRFKLVNRSPLETVDNDILGGITMSENERIWATFWLDPSTPYLWLAVFLYASEIILIIFQ